MDAACALLLLFVKAEAVAEAEAEAVAEAVAEAEAVADAAQCSEAGKALPLPLPLAAPRAASPSAAFSSCFLPLPLASCLFLLPLPLAFAAFASFLLPVPLALSSRPFSWGLRLQEPGQGVHTGALEAHYDFHHQNHYKLLIIHFEFSSERPPRINKNFRFLAK